LPGTNTLDYLCRGTKEGKFDQTETRGNRSSRGSSAQISPRIPILNLKKNIFVVVFPPFLSRHFFPGIKSQYEEILNKKNIVKMTWEKQSNVALILLTFVRALKNGKLTGRNLNRVFNSRRGRDCICHEIPLITKTA
jgi:hypothetical protein